MISHSSEHRSSVKDSVLRAISIIGLIAILVLGAWGIIQLVFGFSDFFSRFNDSSSTSTTTPSAMNEQLVVTAPNSLTSDQAFPLSWSHTNGTGNYAYTVSYACSEGLSFAAPVPTGQMRIVPCNTPFNFTNASQSLQLIPVLHTTGNATTSVTVTATRLSDNTVAAKRTTQTLVVAPAAVQTAPVVAKTPAPPTRTVAPAPAPTPAPVTHRTSAKPTSNYTASGRTSNLYGAPDLSVQILSLSPDSSGRYAAQFVIQNTGTNVAPRGWTFFADLPLTPAYTFVSQSQQALYPGDKIVYTLGFDAPDFQGSNSGRFAVTADPQNLIQETTKANNTASATLTY